MKRALLAVLALGVVGAALAQAPRVTAAAIARLEHRLDSFLVRGDDPCQLLGNTRGVYLDGYGAVFTTLVALVPTPIPNPFQDFTQKDIDRVYARKLHQVPLMREKMREMLLMMAADPALEGVRPQEEIVCGVTFFYYKQWENSSGLPAQIVMRAQKGQLLEVQSGRTPRSGLGSIVKVQEL